MTTTAQPKKIFKNRVIEGIHYQSTENASELPPHHPDRHKVYKKGEIVLSDQDLSKKFVNKFELVKENEEQVIVSPERQKSVQALLDSGEWEEKDRLFLETLTDDRFEKIKGMNPLAGKISNSSEKSKTQSILGEEVTHLFQQAYDNGFKVFKNPVGKFQVTKGNHNKPVNKEPLEQDGVDKFVAMYLKEK